MKILITGSTGFVGRHLIPKLLLNGHRVLEITRSLDASKALYREQTKKYLLDDDQEKFKREIEIFQPDAVIHLASFITSDYDYSILFPLINSNIYFPCRLLDALQNLTVRIVINTGTFAEYSKDRSNFDPAYLYAASKTASRYFMNYYCKIFKFKLITVVPYTIYGGVNSSKKIIDLIYDSLNSSNPINLSPGKQVLDFIHIEDVIRLYLSLVDNHEQLPDGLNFHLGTGEGHSIREIARIMEQLTGKRANINWGGIPYRKTDIMYAVAGRERNHKFLDWEPEMKLEDGLKKYIAEKQNISLDY